MKYEFTGAVNDYRLKQIRRVSDGLVGGYLESERNLSQEGTCFVYGDAMVSGLALVGDDAVVSGNAMVYGNATIYGSAQIYGNARVSGNASVSGSAWVTGNALISGDANIFGNGIVLACITLQQFKYTITCTDTGVFIGCKGHTWEYWAENYQVIGEESGYTQVEINETIALLNILYVQIQRKIGGK